MEPFMKRVYLATVIAIIITSSIASHVLVVGALGSTTPGLLMRLRSGAGEFLRRLRSFFNAGIAVLRAHRQCRAATFKLSSLNDRELKDIGLYRSNIAHLAERTRQRCIGGEA